VSKADFAGARSRARELIVQALYQREIAGHDKSELLQQFRERRDYEQVDQAYFDELLTLVCKDFAALTEALGKHVDRPVEQIDPVELSILLLGYAELKSRQDIPFRAVINEGVKLAHRFGAEDSHKYINAVLDRAASELRSGE